jgi:hypothetical protein
MATTTDQTSNPSLNQGASPDAPARVGVAKLAASLSADKITSGMSLNSQLPDIGAEIKQVGHKSYEGSNAGDHRGQTADAVLPSNPGPREPQGQSKVQAGE